MTIGSNLSLRLAAILLIGFIALQLLIATLVVPSSRDARRPYNLPRPDEAAALANALDRARATERRALIEAMDGGLYRVELASAPLPFARARGADYAALAARYAAAMPGRQVEVEGRRRRLYRLIGNSPRIARFFAPVRVSIGLKDGSRLLVTSQPSDAMRSFIRNRSVVALLGGVLLLVVLMLAVRQTTRPLSRLSRGVRRTNDLDAPDLPVAGPREVQELATAFNELKARIRGLMAERTRVLAAIAHDMRTYLTRLRLRAELIDDAEMRARSVRDLAEMSALLDDTLLLARQDAGPPPAPSAIDLGAELATIVEARREQGDAVTLDPVAEGLRIRATPLSFRRVLANLLDNGLRHGTRVTLGAARQGDAVEIIVRDDGPGVPPEELARLGEPFHRLDPSRDRETGGAGLGLAIVRALADRDGASVSFMKGDPAGLAVRLRYPLA